MFFNYLVNITVNNELEVNVKKMTLIVYLIIKIFARYYKIKISNFSLKLRHFLSNWRTKEIEKWKHTRDG